MIKDIFDKQVLELKKLWANKRQLLFQLLNLAMIVFSALMIWKALMCYTKVRESQPWRAFFYSRLLFSVINSMLSSILGVLFGHRILTPNISLSKPFFAFFRIYVPHDNQHHSIPNQMHTHIHFMISLLYAFQSESPVVVVLSGSMEPAFQRGDILFLNNSVEQVGVGDVVVFKIRDRDIPIVHRILKVHEDEDGKVELLTKGDNNRVDDRGLYAPGQLWLEREDILGKAVGTLRYVGMVTIALNDYPVLKYVLVGMMGLFVLTSKEG